MWKERSSILQMHVLRRVSRDKLEPNAICVRFERSL